MFYSNDNVQQVQVQNVTEQGQTACLQLKKIELFLKFLIPLR